MLALEYFKTNLCEFKHIFEELLDTSKTLGEKQQKYTNFVTFLNQCENNLNDNQKKAAIIELNRIYEINCKEIQDFYNLANLFVKSSNIHIDDVE